MAIIIKIYRLCRRILSNLASLFRGLGEDQVEFRSLRGTLRGHLIGIIDVLTLPLAYVTALHMRWLRRYGVHNSPIAHRILLRRGVWPILRHYHEPLFHPGDLSDTSSNERNLPGIKLNEAKQLDLLTGFHYQEEILRVFRGASPPTFSGYDLNPDNPTFRHGDIDFYYNVIRHFQPQRIIEIGGGRSTMVALCATEANAVANSACQCEITSIEPYPWFLHDRVTLVKDFAENINQDLFATLQANDILFVDSSHMIRPGGDVIYQVLNLLPRLADGVIVHVHDVFTPFNYPRGWVGMLWNEQYLLEAFLTCNPDFEIIGALQWLRRHHRALMEEKCPLLKQADEMAPWSFWIRRKQKGMDSGNLVSRSPDLPSR